MLNILEKINQDEIIKLTTEELLFLNSFVGHLHDIQISETKKVKENARKVASYLGKYVVNLENHEKIEEKVISDFLLVYSLFYVEYCMCLLREGKYNRASVYLTAASSICKESQHIFKDLSDIVCRATNGKYKATISRFEEDAKTVEELHIRLKPYFINKDLFC